MKLRYYLRGLGIGLLLCTALSLASDHQGGQMSDAQIRVRALELGMIQNPVLTDLPANENTEESSEDLSETVTTESEQSETAETVEQITTEPTAETKENESEMPEETKTEMEAASVITITINKGDGSGTVSQRLFEAGLVTDAKTYDRYLMEHGYDRKLTPGNHEISSGATEEEIAMSLCR